MTAHQFDDIVIGCLKAGSLSFIVIACAGLLWLFMMMGFILRADMLCTERGYPKAKVTVNLKSYCMTLDGAVTVRMEQLP